MANLSKKVMDIASGLIVRSIVSIIYELALASLIPLTIVLFTPGFVLDWNFAGSVLAVLGLISVCFIILVWNKGKVHKAWTSLGLMTLLPGALALLFIYISPETLFNIISQICVKYSLIILEELPVVGVGYVGLSSRMHENLAVNLLKRNKIVNRLSCTS